MRSESTRTLGTSSHHLASTLVGVSIGVLEAVDPSVVLLPTRLGSMVLEAHMEDLLEVLVVGLVECLGTLDSEVGPVEGLGTLDCEVAERAIHVMGLDSCLLVQKDLERCLA